MSAITATPKAVAEVLRLQEKRAAEGKPAQGLRIGIRGGGCTGFSYMFEWADEAPRPTDKVFEFERGVKLFVEQRGKKTICAMSQDTDFGRDVMDGVRDQMKAMKINLAAETLHKPTDTDFSASVAEAPAATADA